MIMGELCTRRCRSATSDTDARCRSIRGGTARTIAALKLAYVVITVWIATTCAMAARSISSIASVPCEHSPSTRIEVRFPISGRLARARRARYAAGRDESQPRESLALQAGRPGADYANSLELLSQFKSRVSRSGKSGLMVGLGKPTTRYTP
jgi:lipoate synthase